MMGMSNFEFQKFITAPCPKHNGHNPYYNGSFFVKRSELKSSKPFISHDGRWFKVN